MGSKTKIQWADRTFNPWIGCTRVSQGCVNCYAENQDKRKVWGGTTHWGPGKPRFVTSETYWKQPARWQADQVEARKAAHAAGLPHPPPPRVFCASMADVCDPEAPAEARARLWPLIKSTRLLDWLLLTKRPELFADVLPWHMFKHTHPSENVWLGTTTEDQTTHSERVPHLLANPAHVHWLSVEPMLGPVRLHPDFVAHARQQRTWVICGGESGANARPFHMEWAFDLLDQCTRAGIPFFMKQLGSAPVFAEKPWVAPPENTDMHHYGDPAGWPEALRVRQLPPGWP